MQTLIYSGISATEIDLNLPATLYYVSNSTVQRGAFLDDTDCAEFLTLLVHNFSQRHWRCYGYCLLPDGYDMLVETSTADLSHGVGEVQHAYARRFRQRYHVTRSRFWEAYRVFFVEPNEYLLPVNRHIVRRPIETRMVDKALQWRWSSYGATVGQTQPGEWLQTTELLDRITRLKAMARRRYRVFVEEPAYQSVLADARYGMFLGDAAFVQRTVARLSGGPTGLAASCRQSVSP